MDAAMRHILLAYPVENALTYPVVGWQSDHMFQAATLQGTTHGLVPHGCVWVRAGHGMPPVAEFAATTDLARILLPLSHEALVCGTTQHNMLFTVAYYYSNPRHYTKEASQHSNQSVRCLRKYSKLIAFLRHLQAPHAPQSPTLQSPCSYPTRCVVLGWCSMVWRGVVRRSHIRYSSPLLQSILYECFAKWHPRH